VPYKNFHEDPNALLDKAETLQAPLIYLANPDNPMGTWHSADVIQGMIDDLPENTVLALDEAYIEFAVNDIAPAINTDKPNVIRFRTFSKAYGMAGQRIAYAIAHRDIIAGYNKIRNHFGLNRIAQIGALAAVNDSLFIPRVNQTVAAGREKIMNFAAARGLYAEPSYTNFVAIDLENHERAQHMIKQLAEHDVFMRMPGVEPLNRCVRVGVGTEEEFSIFAEAFKQAL